MIWPGSNKTIANDTKDQDTEKNAPVGWLTSSRLILYHHLKWPVYIWTRWKADKLIAVKIWKSEITKMHIVPTYILCSIVQKDSANIVDWAENCKFSSFALYFFCSPLFWFERGNDGCSWKEECIHLLNSGRNLFPLGAASSLWRTVKEAPPKKDPRKLLKAYKCLWLRKPAIIL